MATYAEIYALQSDSALRNRLQVAAIVAADAIRVESSGVTGHALRATWARQALENPERMAERLFWAVLAQNRAQTVANVQGATDAQLQTAVDNAVNLLAGV